MSKLKVILTFGDDKEVGGAIAVVKLHEGVFTQAQLEGWYDSDWTDRVGDTREVSGIPSFSGRECSITLVCAAGVDSASFKKTVMKLVGELFEIVGEGSYSFVYLHS